MYHLRPLFILDRIYILLYTGCPPGAMFSRCALCLFNMKYLFIERDFRRLLRTI
jgi:hypothetical protein